MRWRLLTALLLSGAAFAQLPPADTLAGAELVDTFLSVLNNEVDSFIAAYDSVTVGPGTWSYSVAWQVPNVDAYSGQFASSNLFLTIDTAMSRFWGEQCATPDLSRCGRLIVPANNQGVAERPQSTTGTDLEAWRDHTQLIPAFAFAEAGNDTAPLSVEFWCDNGSQRLLFGTTKNWWAGGGQFIYNGWTETRATGSASWSGPYKRFTGSGAAGLTSVTNSMLSRVQTTCPMPGMAQYRDGSFYGRMQMPAAHPSLRDGVRIVMAETQAENDRTGVSGLVIAGMALDPLPTVDQLEQGEGGTDPGGGDGAVDPGNCEEGWFLTQLVCIIRDQGERLWDFIGNDAWVPQEDWGARFTVLNQSKNSKFPFTVSYQSTLLESANYSQSEQLACAVSNLSFDFLQNGSPVTATIDWCNNQIADLGHDLLRPALFMFVVVIAGFSLIKAVAGLGAS